MHHIFLRVLRLGDEKDQWWGRLESDPGPGEVSASKGGPCGSQQLRWLIRGRMGLSSMHHVGPTGRNSLITCRYAIRQFLSTSTRLPPLMSTSSPSPLSSLYSSSSPIYRIPIVTTTIFSPSATSRTQPANDNGRTTIPIGSIVGGCLAGIVIAVAAVVGWHLWGRSIKRKEEAKRKEAVRSLFTCSP